MVSKAERAERSRMLHGLSEKKKRYFYEQQQGTSAQVLFEDDVQEGYMHGFTENYVRVVAKYDPLLVNETKAVYLTGLNEAGLMEVTEPEEVLVH